MTRFPEERDEILSLCLEKLVQAHWSLEECVALFPEWRDDIIALMPLVRTFRRAQAIQPRPSFSISSRKRLERRIELRSGTTKKPVQKRSSIFSRGRTRSGQPALWPYALASLGIMLLLTLITGVVTVRAADNAVPGEALYRLDRALENRALRRESDPTVATIKQLQFAQERIAEMEILIAEGNTPQAQVALVEYGSLVGGVVPGPGGAGGANPALTQTVNEALETQARQMETLLMPGADPDGATASALCDSAETRQVPAAAATIALRYGTTEEQIADWHCRGHNFGEIVVALETSRKTAFTAEELLAERTASAGWGQVWQGMREEAPGSDAGRPGRPDTPGNANPPGQEGVPPGQQEERPGNANPPGQQEAQPGNANPPGQQGERPGNANPPGQQEGSPGNANPPGQQEGAPSNANPPGQQEENPGNANPPGQQEDPPGNSNPPAQDENPGNSGSPPGQSNKPDR